VDASRVPDAALRHAFDLASAREAGADEIEFYARQLPAGGPSLDALCGIGRLLVPLARAGRNVHGVDPSASAVAICEARLAGHGVTASLFRQALPDLNLPFRYGTAFVAGGALQRIVDPTRAFAALSRLRAHLLAPATLIVELAIPPEVLHPPGAPLVEVRTATDADGAQIAWRSETRVDVDGRRVDRNDRFEKREGRTIVAREDARGALTWYLEDEIATLLRSVGFTDIDVIAAPWQRDDGSRRFVAIARM
jgi:SAM-dependent methyltransferase